MESALTHNRKVTNLALGDITIYSKDNGFGYPGDVNYVVATGATVPQILSGEPVQDNLGAGTVTALASGTGAIAWPHTGDALNGANNSTMAGVAASTSNENSSGNINGSVSVTPIDADLTYLIATLQTAQYFGWPSSAITLQQKQYDTNVGARVTLARTAGVGAAMLGGTYTINATDATGNGLVVEALDIQKYPGKVRFSFRKSLSKNA